MWYIYRSALYKKMKLRSYKGMMGWTTVEIINEYRGVINTYVLDDAWER